MVEFGLQVKKKSRSGVRLLLLYGKPQDIGCGMRMSF